MLSSYIFLRSHSRGGAFELINGKKKNVCMFSSLLCISFVCFFLVLFCVLKFFFSPARNARREEDERGSVQEEQSCNI